MQDGIKVLMKNPSPLRKRIRMLENKIERIASYPFLPTKKQIDSILRATEKKRSIEEILALSEKIKRGLTEEEIIVLSMLSKGCVATDIADALGTTKSKAYRLAKQSVVTAQNVLFILGYDQDRLARLISNASI